MRRWLDRFLDNGFQVEAGEVPQRGLSASETRERRCRVDRAARISLSLPSGPPKAGPGGSIRATGRASEVEDAAGAMAALLRMNCAGGQCRIRAATWLAADATGGGAAQYGAAGWPPQCAHSDTVERKMRRVSR